LTEFQTLSLWDINPRLWLTAYLQACATAGGKAPPDLDSYLPWNLNEERRQNWQLKLRQLSSNTS
jgi:hypothetical protein